MNAQVETRSFPRPQAVLRPRYRPETHDVSEFVLVYEGYCARRWTLGAQRRGDGVCEDAASVGARG